MIDSGKNEKINDKCLTNGKLFGNTVIGPFNDFLAVLVNKAHQYHRFCKFTSPVPLLSQTKGTG